MKVGDIFMFIFNIDTNIIIIDLMVQTCLTEFSGDWFLDDRQINDSSWSLVYDHWVDKVDKNSILSYKFVVSNEKDALLFKLKFGDYIHND